jgi:hypothetical protein
MSAAAATGLKDHDRWRGAHTLLARKLANRRSTSHLPDLRGEPRARERGAGRGSVLYLKLRYDSICLT